MTRSFVVTIHGISFDLLSYIHIEFSDFLFRFISAPEKRAFFDAQIMVFLLL